MPDSAPPIPARQIRAVFDDETVTVYQAYSSEIAEAAVCTQRLDASAHFRRTRMTWVKPSWCWMLYRAGYGAKDSRQARILALRLRRAGFEALLRTAELSHALDGDDDKGGKNPEKPPLRFRPGSARVQWDPERGPRLERYVHRSIQIGVPPELVGDMVTNWIVGIEDVTQRALALKTAVEVDGEVGVEELVARGLMPVEKVYPTPPDIAEILHMNV